MMLRKIIVQYENHMKRTNMQCVKNTIAFTVGASDIYISYHACKVYNADVQVCSHTTRDLFHFHVSKFARHSIIDPPFTRVQEQQTCVFHTKRIIHLLEAELYWHAKPVLYVPGYHCGASFCDTFWRVTNENNY